MTNNYRSLDGLGLAQALRDKELSPQETLESAIALADKLNPDLNAIVMRHDEQATKQAKDLKLDASFSGVPFLLKNLHTQLKGTDTDSSCSLLRSKPAKHNSTLVDYFQQAGLVIFGKTNSPEFGLTGTTEPRLYGATKNPWGDELSPAGSSGGAGAAVAAGIVPLAHASDGGGSIRMPAAANGLVGMKPSRGRVSFAPDRGEGWAGMSCNGVLSRSVRDSAVALDEISPATPAPGEPYGVPQSEMTFYEACQSDPAPLRIAVNWHRPSGEKLDDKMVAHVQATAKLCENLGHAVEEASYAYRPQEAGVNQMVLIGSHIAALLEDMGADENTVERATWRIGQFGKKQTGQNYVRAVNYIHALSRVAGDFHKTYDVYLCPTFAVENFRLGELDMMSDDVETFNAAHARIMPFTSFANMTGQPSISLPMCWTKSGGGTPVGMMMTAAYGAEALLFQLAGQLERAAPWQQHYEKLWQKLD